MFSCLKQGVNVNLAPCDFGCLLIVLVRKLCHAVLQGWGCGSKSKCTSVSHLIIVSLLSLIWHILMFLCSLAWVTPSPQASIYRRPGFPILVKSSYFPSGTQIWTPLIRPGASRRCIFCTCNYYKTDVPMAVGFCQFMTSFRVLDRKVLQNAYNEHIRCLYGSF